MLYSPKRKSVFLKVGKLSKGIEEVRSPSWNGDEEQRVGEEKQKARTIRENGENDIMFISATALKETAV